MRQPQAHQAHRGQEIEARALLLVLQGAEEGRADKAGQGRDGKLSHAPSWIHAPPPGQRAEAETTRTTRTTRLWAPCQATPTDLEKQRRGRDGEHG